MYDINKILNISIFLPSKTEKQKQMHRRRSPPRLSKPLPGMLDIEDIMRLTIGSECDFRDEVGQFVEAKIVDQRETQVLIHFKGWADRWDLWVDKRSSLDRFAVIGAISRSMTTHPPTTKFGLEKWSLLFSSTQKP